MMKHKRLKSQMSDEALVHFAIKRDGETVGCLWVSDQMNTGLPITETKYTALETMNPDNCPRCSRPKKAKVA